MRLVTSIVLLMLSCVPSLACSMVQVLPRPDREGSATQARHLKQEAYIQARLADSDYATIGIGDSIMGMWPSELLDSRWGGPVLNAGRGGSTTSHWLRWLDEWDWSRQNPSTVYINIGRNDLTLDMCPSVVSQSVVRLIGKVRTKWPNATVVWQNISPGGQYLELLEQEIRDVNRLTAIARANSRSFLIVDAWTVLYSRCVGRKVCGLFLEGDRYPSGPIHLGVDAYELINRDGKVLQ